MAQRDGPSMLVFAGDDARADIANFKAAGVPTFAPFDFERLGKLPNGTEVTLAFSFGLRAIAGHAGGGVFRLLKTGRRRPFWKSEYQSHANGATGIAAVYLASPAPERDAAFVGKMFGGDVSRMPGGSFRVACGPSQELHVLTPQDLGELDRSLEGLDRSDARLVGIALRRRGGGGFTPAAEAGGMFIEWM